MQILHDVSLAGYSTMRLGGKARFLVNITSKDELLEALAWAKDQETSTVIIGGGANLIFSDTGFDGLVMVNDIKGLTLAGKDENLILRAGAGEIWDDTVAYSVEHGLTGLESLSFIPGKTGAAAVQNIGAYGQDVAQTLTSVEAYDTRLEKFVQMSNVDCGFGYRSSRFNRTDKGRFLITSLTFKLHRDNPHPPYYRDIEAYLNKHPVETVTPAVIRSSVIEIRGNKLPNPAVIANSGSFFYNPIVSKEFFEGIVALNPELKETPPGWTQPPYWVLGTGQIKISAARLIELAGMADYDDPKTGIAVWPKQHLVLINNSASKTASLLAAKQKIVDAVESKFGLILEQEPELLA